MNKKFNIQDLPGYSRKTYRLTKTKREWLAIRYRANELFDEYNFTSSDALKRALREFKINILETNPVPHRPPSFNGVAFMERQMKKHKSLGGVDNKRQIGEPDGGGKRHRQKNETKA